jgi:hypothetical protein
MIRYYKTESSLCFRILEFRCTLPPPIPKLALDQPLLTYEIPSGKAGSYRDAQWDDHSRLPRNKFLHSPPLSLTLQARVSGNTLPGTWGFGFWNDPFSLGIGVKGSSFRLPALPEAAWFFYGSEKNDLSFRSENPKNGLMASVFTSTSFPSIFLPFGLPLLPLLAFKPTARWVRRIASRFIRDESMRLKIDTTQWHTYRLDWLTDQVRFFVDEVTVFTSLLSPKPPLGLVIWIDNQYAAFSADGSVRFGLEENPIFARLEIKNLKI